MLTEFPHSNQNISQPPKRLGWHALAFGGLAVAVLASFFLGFSPVRFSHVETGQLIAAPHVENVGKRLEATHRQLAESRPSLNPDPEQTPVLLAPQEQATPISSEKLPVATSPVRSVETASFEHLAGEQRNVVQASFATPQVAVRTESPRTIAHESQLPAPKRPAEISRELFKSDSARATVVVFLSAECPASIGSVPQLARLHAAWEDLGVHFVGVLADPDSSKEWATWFQRVNRLRFGILADQTGRIRQTFQPTHTPEVFVLNAQRELVYRGRIDDRFAESRRFQVPQTYLDDAIAAVVYSERVPVARTRAIGSPIETSMPPNSATQFAERPNHSPATENSHPRDPGVWHRSN